MAGASIPVEAPLPDAVLTTVPREQECGVYPRSTGMCGCRRLPGGYRHPHHRPTTPDTDQPTLDHTVDPASHRSVPMSSSLRFHRSASNGQK